MQTKTYNIYTYDELTPQAQEKARDWYKDGNEYYWLGEYMNELAVELLTTAGFTNLHNPKCFYSLSYCQGDGAMIEFTGDYKGMTVTVKNSGRYSHERSTDISITDEDGEDVNDKIHEEIEETILVPLFIELKRAGYAYIEAENEDENVAESIRVNEYTFLENGKRSD